MGFGKVSECEVWGGFNDHLSNFLNNTCLNSSDDKL